MTISPFAVCPQDSFQGYLNDCDSFFFLNNFPHFVLLGRISTELFSSSAILTCFLEQERKECVTGWPALHPPPDAHGARGLYPA